MEAGLEKTLAAKRPAFPEIACHIRVIRASEYVSGTAHPRCLRVPRSAKGEEPVINLFRMRGLSDQLVAEGTDVSAASADAFFAELVDATYRRTYRLIYRMVRNEGDAADLTQEVFVRVYRALPRLRAHGAAASWVRKIAINLCLDHIRRQRSAPVVTSIDAPCGADGDQHAHLELADPSGEPDRILDASETSRLINAAIDALPPDYRAVIVLHHVEEMRVEEIAQLFGVPVGTVKSRLSRARKALQRRLAPYFSP